MYSFLSFKNATSSPVISIYDGYQKIVSDLIRGTSSGYTTLKCGSANIIVLNNFGKKIHDVLISIKPHLRNSVIITDDSIEIK